MSQIDATLAPLQSGEDAGKIPVDLLRQQLATAKAELEAIELQLVSLTFDNSSNVNEIAELGQQMFTISQNISALQNDLNALAIDDINGLQNALNDKQPSGNYATAAQGAKADSAVQPNVANNFAEPNQFVKTFALWQAVAFNATQTLNAAIPAGTTTLTGNMTLNAVSNSNANEMQVIVRAFTQDATGGRTIAYNTSVFSAGSAVFPQPNPTANRVSLFQFTKMPDGKWVVQSLNDVRSA